MSKRPKRKKAAQQPQEILGEPTTFIVMILRPHDPGADPAGNPNLLAVLTGWCVIAAHGLDAALAHVQKINFGLDLTDVTWKDVSSNGKMATLADGKAVQVLPAPLYLADVPEPEPEPLIVPPYIM